eukprot:330069_1
MGLQLSRNKWTTGNASFGDLTYYETSNEVYTFSKEHTKQLREALSHFQLDVMTETIISFLCDMTVEKQLQNWKHNNYTTYIHPTVTPLNNNCKGVSPEWLRYIHVNGQYLPIVMLGGGGVGKSSLTIRFITDRFVKEYDPSLEDSYIKEYTLNVMRGKYDTIGATETMDGCEKQTAKIEILDTAGSEEFSSIMDQWLHWGQIFMLVFNVMNEQTFDEIQIHRERILRTKDARDGEGSYRMIAVGNKCDLRMDNADESLVHYRRHYIKPVDMNQVGDWCKQYDIPYIETSAKTGKNVALLYRQCVYEYWVKIEKLKADNTNN